jgi:adenine-specific DNA-methyltransferase
LPCICKAIDSKKPFFLKEDFEELKANDKSVFLLNAISPIDEHTKKYLQFGEEHEINKKFLTANRNPWYSIENRPPAPIWVSVFNRNGLRFIRNEANISNLTTFHCIYPSKANLFDSINIDLLFAYLLTNVAKQIFEDNSREYGNGLQKFEPNDINKAQMLDLKILDLKIQNKIIVLYNLYKKTVIENKPDESIVIKINEIFIENFT